MEQLTFKDVKVQGIWRHCVVAFRVPYGKPETPLTEREYTLFKIVLSPVGTIKELTELPQHIPALEFFDGFILIDRIHKTAHYLPINPSEDNYGIVELPTEGDLLNG